MTQAEFRKNFSKTGVVPSWLMKLLGYQQRVQCWYSGRFRLSGEGRETAIASFDGDKKAASQFVLFGRNPDGSSYGCWLYDGRKLDNAPIVYLGSEGTGWTVLANNLEEFLSLLAVGEDEIGFAAPNLTEPDEPSENLTAFREWLKGECGITRPKYPALIVAKAVRKHPDLQAWLGKWQESHFGREASGMENPPKGENERPSGEVSLSDELKQLLGSPLEEVAKRRLVSSLAGNPKIKKKAGIEFSAGVQLVLGWKIRLTKIMQSESRHAISVPLPVPLPVPGLVSHRARAWARARARAR